ncbi:hypothetical protein GE21DRAFT_5037 [Neurospora crassa]|uniref:Uncharacterized protein n=1 Tax=Neurospora crassa (strain ATCC 24698 / 74-OR23-1A / CBS 708.71 / DSM 1257 / FGSC 987) TaxID=367110 RepID=Q7S3I9_NEUCR|nr:hypothetical protein NCU08254 [Neurospora crassa OR74A]EAA30108.1 hypothetical protein NCU08254 [Neurospora crassa OR74A]KHE86512.1 hypothetical protein GE21DRAFT_5037 [Neurospora crassa]|eukprot:XP_959344.1 hypothetical protein NCU08254 [Neurospora crassa OR74A]
MDSDSSEAGSPSPALQPQAIPGAVHLPFDQNAAPVINNQVSQAITGHPVQHATASYPHFDNTDYAAQPQIDGHQGNAPVLNQGSHIDSHHGGGVQGSFDGQQAQPAFSANYLSNNNQPLNNDHPVVFNQPFAPNQALAFNHPAGMNHPVAANQPIPVNMPVAIPHAQAHHPAVRALFTVTQFTPKEEKSTSIALLAGLGEPLGALLCSFPMFRSMTLRIIKPSKRAKLAGDSVIRGYRHGVLCQPGDWSLEGLRVRTSIEDSRRWA